MRDRLTSYARKGGATFSAFTIGQKAVTIVAVLTLAVGGYFFATWASTPTLTPLFSNLAAADASAIVDKLAADGVVYELADGGNTIMVPRDQVYDLRIKLSGEGLPSEGDAGYSLLDQQGVMTSEFMQQVSYRRALEGELSNTIKSISGVTAATVHLAIPEKDVFTDEQQPTTASVLVSTGTKSLSEDKVNSIVHLVSSSVEGLDPEQVTVVGANGRVLSNTEDGMASGSDSRANRTTAYEQRLNASLQRMLEQVLGPGNAVVQVTADLDFDATETKTQKYIADPAVPPLSETKKTEAYTGGGTPTGGVLGPDNIQVPTGTGTTGNYQQSTETRNNAVGMVTEVRKSAPGAVNKLSVAVIVDSGVAKVDEAQLTQLVSSAAGLDPQRGDTIAVSAMAFDTSTETAEQQAIADAAKADANKTMQQYIQMGSIVGGVIVLMVIAMFSSRRRRKKENGRLTAEANATLEQMQAALEAARSRLAVEGNGGNGAAAAIDAAPSGPNERELRQREITALVEQQPDEVASLLRGWLADRRG